MNSFTSGLYFFPFYLNILTNNDFSSQFFYKNALKTHIEATFSLLETIMKIINRNLSYCFKKGSIAPPFLSQEHNKCQNYRVPRRINPSLESHEFLSESDRISSDILRKLSHYLWNPGDGTDIGS